MNYIRQFDSKNPLESVTWETRPAEIKQGEKVVFKQENIRAPKEWSQLATNIAASKYFYRPKETGIDQLIERVADTIAVWGLEDRYFENDSATAFKDDLTWLLLHQYGAFNSPVWFNIGLYQKYGVVGTPCNWYWDKLTNRIKQANNPFEHPQLSACFIQGVEDSLDSIMELASTDALLFKFGSGTGTNLSPLRSSCENLSGGGHSSGPLSFMRIYDQVAETVTSGGRCLAGNQCVYTDKGPQSVKDLVDTRFPVISYHPPANQFQAKWATAWQSGTKEVLKITTDKGSFEVSSDHPFWLANKQVSLARDLKINQRLFACNINQTSDNYLRIGLRQGSRSGKRARYHNWLAQYLMPEWFEDCIVHHKDGNSLNNSLDNLEILTQSQHATKHGKQLSSQNSHIFQIRNFSHAGTSNGMHSSNAFWKNKQKVAAYKQTQRQGTLKRGRKHLAKCARQAVKQRLCNQAWNFINLGFSIDTEDQYIQAWVTKAKSENKRTQFPHFAKDSLKSICRFFGTYEKFLQELNNSNHKILAIESLGIQSVYSIEVECDTIDDKTCNSGHNYVIWPSNKEATGSGVVVSNTRRAALLHCLDMGHPDIAEFISCKAEEEAHARMLIDRGVSPERAARSVMYQNMNISVQVPDAFMQAVTNDTEWCTHWITDPKKNGPEYKAKELWHKLAESTWLCGDPGVQFCDTINKWNTIPKTGKVVASNPCGEHLSINQSACNLASINLLKFLKDGKFDFETFQKVVRVFIIAQDILIDRASYPLKDIARNAHRCRQIGLGYTNLGALLMSMGLPYDSDEGRNLAARITATMTARAYLTSAELAEDLGSFEEYDINRVEMHDVLEMHYEEAKKLGDVAELWQEVCSRPYFRNCQTTLSAPTGTISFLMDCDTTGIEPELALVKTKQLVGGGTLKLVNKSVEAGLQALGISDKLRESILQYLEANETLAGNSYLTQEELKVFETSLGDNAMSWQAHIKMLEAVQPFLSAGISKCVTGDTRIITPSGLERIDKYYKGEKPDVFSPLKLKVSSINKNNFTDAFYFGGRQKVQTVKLRSGHKITGTLNHPLLTQDGWKQIQHLQSTDYIAVHYGTNRWPKKIPEFTNFKPSKLYGGQHNIKVPKYLTTDLSFFIGAYLADGNITRSNWSIIITKNDPQVLEKIKACIFECFGLDARLTYPKNRCPNLIVSSKSLIEFFDYLGLVTSSNNKVIPECFFYAPKKYVTSMLSGLFLDSYISKNRWGICLASNRLLDGLQILLTNLGIPQNRCAKYNLEYNRFYEEILVTGDYAKKLLAEIPIVEKYKANRIQNIGTSNCDTMNIIPFSTKAVLSLIPKHLQQKYHDLRYHQYITRKKARQLLVDGIQLPLWITTALLKNIFYYPIKSISRVHKELVYDISVPIEHNFIGNGIINHNTINMPATATTEEIADAYMLGWKSGLKSMTIYRDGSKGYQPVNVKQPTPAIIGKKQEARTRLPDTRESITHKFTIDGHKGYLTVGLYPDGKPGELFISVAKEGSTLGGIFDCFGLATSIGLQYGVPLSEFIDKFTHVRFEPMGYTENPEIRIAKSIIDYIFRWLAIKFQAGTIPHDVNAPIVDILAAPKATLDAPACDNCGAIMVRTGTCYLCHSCGTSGGCS